MLCGMRSSLRLAAARQPSSLFARSLRLTPAVQSELSRTATGGSLATVDPMKYVDSESLVAHQARVRHADPANRTFNYAMIGACLLLAAPLPPSDRTARGHALSSHQSLRALLASRVCTLQIAAFPRVSPVVRRGRALSRHPRTHRHAQPLPSRSTSLFLL